MKKFLIACLVITLLLCSSLSLIACNPNEPDSGPTSGSGATDPSDPVEPVEPDEKATYTVRFMVDDEVYETVSGKEGTRISKPKKDPTKEHMTFVKWEGYENSARFTENKDYVAVFKDTEYKIEFISLGETIETIKGKYGDTFTVPTTPTAGANYTFLGWDGLNADDLVIKENKQYVAKWDIKAPEIAYTTGAFDANTLTKDAIFTNAAMITEFKLVQKPDAANDPSVNDTYKLYLANDGTYLYVYIESVEAVMEDADRLGFYFAEKDKTDTTYVETYPDKGEIAKGESSCEAVKAGKDGNHFVLKAKIALSKLAIDDDNKISFGVRFVNHAAEGSTHFVYLSDGSVADDGSGTKVTKVVNLPKMKLATASIADA